MAKILFLSFPEAFFSIKVFHRMSQSSAEFAMDDKNIIIKHEQKTSMKLI